MEKISLKDVKQMYQEHLEWLQEEDTYENRCKQFNLVQRELENCIFNKRNLAYAEFSFSKTLYSLFIGCNLESVNFENASLRGCIFKEVNLHNANFVDAIIKDSIFTNIRLYHSNLMGAVFKNCIFENVVFNKASLENTDFSKCKFIGCIFKDAYYNKETKGLPRYSKTIINLN